VFFDLLMMQILNYIDYGYFRNNVGGVSWRYVDYNTDCGVFHPSVLETPISGLETSKLGFILGRDTAIENLTRLIALDDDSNFPEITCTPIFPSFVSVSSMHKSNETGCIIDTVPSPMSICVPAYMFRTRKD